MSGSSGSSAIVCATDERATLVESLQTTLGVGPCVDAVTSGIAVLVPDVREPAAGDAERWPGFLSAVDHAGVRAVFAVPLRIGAIRVGALDLHRTEPGPLAEPELRHAYVAADFLAWALAGRDQSSGAGHELPWPDVGVGMQVHQAAGMVQVQLDVPISEALLALRARAFAEGRTVAELAKDVVERRLRFNKEDYR